MPALPQAAAFVTLGRELGTPGRIVSETITRQLAAIRSCRGSVHADDIAAGYVDGAARYWQDHEDEPANVAQAAE